MNPRVRFDDEADVEYRFAGRWYENRREHLGIEFFDAVDATIDQIVARCLAVLPGSVDCQLTWSFDAEP